MCVSHKIKVNVGHEVNFFFDTFPPNLWTASFFFNMYKRMSIEDRIRVKAETIRLIVQYAPTSRPLLTIAKLVQARRAPTHAMWMSLKAHIGRDKFLMLAQQAHCNIQTAMLKERDQERVNDKRVLCNSCLSYRAQVGCPKCKCVKFCIGCAHYGECLACTELS